MNPKASRESKIAEGVMTEVIELHGRTRYTSPSNHRETERESLPKTVERTEAERDKANNDLEDLVDNLQVDATI